MLDRMAIGTFTSTNRRRFGASAGAALFTAVTSRKAFSATTSDRKIELFPDDTIGAIRLELHSHFAEHLGTCVHGVYGLAQTRLFPTSTDIVKLQSNICAKWLSS